MACPRRRGRNRVCHPRDAGWNQGYAASTAGRGQSPYPVNVEEEEEGLATADGSLRRLRVVLKVRTLF